MSTIDWSNHTGPKNVCVCKDCDAAFYSYSKFVLDPKPGIVSKDPCPMCSGHLLSRASYASSVEERITSAPPALTRTTVLEGAEYIGINLTTTTGYPISCAFLPDELKRADGRRYRVTVVVTAVPEEG